ncbi:GNAT family N-acetyltransferase [Sinimarinibacterium sp. CAU 1509]|uniref:GNAT family N-acetyltransferase n=1 Tax=Sinimarinibacterium sp. CAU 1509 TaxID=2562283 RepID=UPI0010AC94FD|nr:GNAT family N-acetyltransferase [Sinimarinibacterium sp. CAU 1509]TJY64977.1 GNAT family N-acetyltransferase [Sinimarinibacterium sp. CAU 1509]
MPASTPESAESGLSAGSLFTSAAYLQPLERHGCVTPAIGWIPTPIRLNDGAWAPCYRKSHSWGEFVFDFQIAQAYQQQGLAYYPKLVCCVPFTPVPGPRLIAATDTGRLQIADAFMDQLHVQQASSAHLLYLPASESRLLAAHGWLQRAQLRYVWHNRAFADFDAFLAVLNARRRKNIRAERRKQLASALDIHWCAGDTLDDSQWNTVYALYARTYEVRGQRPYLNLACLRDWARNFGARMQFCLAQHRERIVAAAFFFEDGDTLFGRHWGAEADIDGLHFELCYYQGIEHAIAHGLQHFDAGVQGEHKILRGFEPELAHSAHRFVDPRMHAAISRYFAQEQAALQHELDALAQHTRLHQDNDAPST